MNSLPTIPFRSRPGRLRAAQIGSSFAGPTEVLIVQNALPDASDVRALLCETPANAFHLTWVRNCADAIERLLTTGPSPVAAVLVDLFLPDSEGVDTFNRISQAAPHTPIVILTSAAHEDVAIMLVERGAAEYLLKERLNESLLPKIVSSVVARARIADALFDEQERARVTLNSIGDGVVSTGIDGRITYLNAVAESMTGWCVTDAIGHPLEEIIHIIDAESRVRIRDPLSLAVREDRIGGITPNCLLVRRDGIESAIDDSVAPIHDRRGNIAGAVMVFRDVSAARAKYQRLAHQAQHDALTNLSNRFLLHDRLTQAISMAKRHTQKVAVLFMDLDQFKDINDALGHDVGDRLLQSVSRRLMQAVRDSDTVCRAGSDEFIILLSEIPKAADAAVSADRILVAIGADHRVEGHVIHTSASIGIAVYPDDGDDAELLVSHADAAMYVAKSRGRNNYQFYAAEEMAGRPKSDRVSA